VLSSATPAHAVADAHHNVVGFASGGLHTRATACVSAGGVAAGADGGPCDAAHVDLEGASGKRAVTARALLVAEDVAVNVVAVPLNS